MLFNLESFNIIVSQSQRADNHDGQNANRTLYIKTSPKGHWRYHNGPCNTKQGDEDGNVAIDSMNKYQFVPDDGHKLDAGQDSGGYYGI